MAKYDWVKAAMIDDTLVAVLLVSLKQQSNSSSKHQVLLPLKWGHRQRRSKNLSSSSANKNKDGGDSARGSPITPLSWSGGGGCGAGSSASPSGTTGDGSEESSRFNGRCVSSSRSKATVLENSNATVTTSKWSTRKKTLKQLKEREAILLEESVHLKKEIATMHSTFVEHRAQNDNLKRIKLDFGLTSSLNGTTATADKRNEIMIASTSTLPLPGAGNHLSDSGSCQPSTSELSQRDRAFVLPDLNMMPSEEDSGSETILYRPI